MFMNFGTGLMAGASAFLTTNSDKNPANYLTDGSSQSMGLFGNLLKTLQSALSEGYSLIMTVGIGVLACCLVVAFILFGALKDSTAIKDNKKWIVRLLGAVIGIACVMTVIGIAFGIGAKFK